MLKSAILAFTSDFVPRARYRYLTGGLEGYVNASLSSRPLSFYNITPGVNSTEVNCQIWDQRESVAPFDFTREYYVLIMSKFVFLAAYEHLVFFLISVIHWLVPDVPKRIQDQIEREALITQRALWQVKPDKQLISSFMDKLVQVKKKTEETTTKYNTTDDATDDGTDAFRNSERRVSVRGMMSRNVGFNSFILDNKMYDEKDFTDEEEGNIIKTNIYEDEEDENEHEPENESETREKSHV